MRRNLINKMQHENGSMTEEVLEMEGITRAYFQKLFSAALQGNYSNILAGVERCITEADNCKLKSSYTKEEIQEAFLEMGPTKAPGEDGLPAIFY
ncbi:hypothetical protein J1N35_043173 [Gossypium stocksii]|uniref:Reverse transcriptase domain-containing protein n=1 Tax=Gossypium stocksii TaxID=47602 RepID=A0A9D3U6Z5_9ROSI|nr:hypothetical protein J1N35_043173 [Gossypium stocksii]